MKPMIPSQDVVPLSELRANLADLLKQTQQTGRPIVITQHGRGAAVMLSAEAYEELLERVELMRAVVQGQASIAGGKGIPHKQAVAMFKATLEGAKAKPAAGKRKPKVPA